MPEEIIEIASNKLNEETEALERFCTTPCLRKSVTFFVFVIKGVTFFFRDKVKNEGRATFVSFQLDVALLSENYY